MKCVNCGTELNPNSKFCGKCGSPNPEPVYTDISSNFGNQPIQQNTSSMQYSNQVQPQNNYSAVPQYSYTNNSFQNHSGNIKKSKFSPLIFGIIAILAALILFVVFNILLIANVIDTRSSNILDGYKHSLFEVLNISEKNDNNEIEYEQNANEDSYEYNIITEPEATMPTEPTTSYRESLPPELQQYESGLVYEGRVYRIILQQSDWYLNYRSTPVYKDINNPGGNILGKMKHGTEVYVEYIYDGMWAVFQKDGRYVFASLYDNNDASKDLLMVAS